MSKSSTPKSEESKLDRLRHFLGIGGKPGNAPVSHSQRPMQQHIFTPEILKEIGPASPANNRMRTIRDLCDVVQVKRLEENAIEALWKSVSDLLSPNIATEDRHLALCFLTALIKGQYEQLGIMRAHFFRIIKEHTLFEDLPLRLDMFKVLSSDGKDLAYFEEETGLFLLEWMKDVISSSKIAEFLSLLVNVIKYNAAYLDEDVVAALVLSGQVLQVIALGLSFCALRCRSFIFRHTTLIANRTGREEDIGLCLKVLDTVVAYSCLPPDSLYQFTACMCRIVYIEQFSQSCWMLMRKLLGTHLGHRGIYTMCCILQDKNNITDSGAILLHGAVFFIGMALWGSKRVVSLKHPASSVLPSFHQALEHSQSSRVAYEVVLSVQRLVTKYGEEQQMVTWDLILDIIEALLRHIEIGASALLISKTHELLTATEELYEHGHFNGSPARLFSIIESCASKRPEASILSLVQYKTQSVHPAHEGWIQMLNQIVDKYFRLESRPMIRWKVLDVLSKVISDNQQLYEDELIESVVLPHLSHMELDPDMTVRQRAAQLFVDLFSSCHTVRGLDLLDLLQRLISWPCCTPPLSSVSPSQLSTSNETLDQSVGGERETEDVNTAVLGLIAIFKVKLFQLPSSHPQRIYELLVKYIQNQYSSEGPLRSSGSIRKAIFELLLALRADGLYRLGLLLVGKERKATYSDHIICAYRPEICERHTKTSDVTSSPPPVVRSSPGFSQQRITVIPYAQAFSIIKDCLEKEKDWAVLEVLLVQLQYVLQNKTLILAATPEDIDRFCARLCAMVSDLSLPEMLLNTPKKFSKSDFHSYIFPVLTCLVSYHCHLDRSRQFGLVRCLEFGLVSKCAKDCVRALTVCALEMNDMMMRQLPSILLKLSQISANMAMAIPLMEFLSSLIRLPPLYMNFVEEQYMSVFAIALPYTNPFKYTHYTVSLAYHVIAMWFLKCKLPFRKRFVSFIVKGLRSNVLRQFEDSANQRARANKDSSHRNRAQSLNDEALKMKAAAARAAAATKAQGSAPAAVDDSMMQFHKELMETCIDMMARYAFSSCGTMPKRTPFAEFLLEGGLSQSWLLGNKIITISTSGGSGVTKSGLCEKCLHIARFAAKENMETTRSSSDQSMSARRRRHKSAAVRSLSETVALKPLSVDDLHLHKQSPREGQGESCMKRQWSDENVPEKEDEKQQMESAEDKLQMVDNVLMSLKANPTDKSIFTKQQCNCWCTLWAEVHIRRPTGNVSWMMRIQNEPDLLAHFPDFPLADMSNLFINPPEDSYDYITRKKIDSMTLGETEYDSLLEEHFERESLNDFPRASQTPDDDETPTSSSLPTLDSTPPLRKSTSSPELSPPKDPLQPAVTKGDENQAPEDLTHIHDSTERRSQSSEAVNSQMVNIQPKPTPTGPGDHGASQPINIPGMAEALGSKDTPTEQGVDSSDAAPRRSRSSTGVSDREKPRRVSIAEPPKRTPSGLETGPLPVMNQAGDGAAAHGGMTPSFIFLQLHHSNLLDCGKERPLLLPKNNEIVDRAVKMLDLVYPYETHKLGVLYVGEGQESDQQAILSNEYGSSRYADFLKGLGDLIRLADCNPETTYVGGLDLHGQDGQFAYALHDDFMQVIFHVATLMPNKESDPNRNAKKLHIGNDYVTVVYNDSGADYKIGTIKGQFNYVNIIVHPLDHGSNAVVVQTRDDIVDIIGHTDTKIISDSHLSKLVRQMAVHANLASTILQRHKSHAKDPFASNWLERLRKIRHTRTKVLTEIGKGEGKSCTGASMEDFTDFV